MTNLLLVLLIAIAATHFIAEVFVTNKKLQNLLNKISFIGMTLFFLIGIVGVFVFGA